MRAPACGQTDPAPYPRKKRILASSRKAAMIHRPNARFCGSPVTGSRLESKGGGYRSRPSSEVDQYLADVGHALRRLMGRHHLVQTETESREHLVLELARLQGFGDVASGLVMGLTRHGIHQHETHRQV